MRLVPPRGRPTPMSRSTQWAIVLGCSALGVLLVVTYLYNSSDPAATLFLQGRSHIPFRVFGPALTTTTTTISSSASQQQQQQQRLPFSIQSTDQVSFSLYTRHEQRDFLYQFGGFCQRGFTRSKENLLLQRFDELPEPYGQELWKYCVLYTGVGNLYWQTDNVVPLPSWTDLFTEAMVQENVAVRIEPATMPSSYGKLDFMIGSDGSSSSIISERSKMHHSILRVVKPFSKVCLGMMRFMTETKHLDPVSVAETLSLYVMNDQNKKGRSWQVWTARCLDHIPGVDNTAHHDLILPRKSKTVLGDICPLLNGGHCCQVWREGEEDIAEPAAVITHSMISVTAKQDAPIPIAFQHRPDNMTESNLGMTVEDFPFVATIRSYPTNAPPATEFETPNYFDILMHNNCLPHDKECFRCLKTGYNEGDEGGDCNVCQKVCPCYCSALCQVRPPPKRLAAEWKVQRPLYRKDPTRLIPRVIHQTWFETVTKESYPNMSRLIESFRTSGWQYEFYDDDRAAEFLAAHFPPEVRQAYDAVIPGAFKADLFRYCVLLIRGGVYADMDIILESNLDKIIESNVGFLTAQDSPGMTIGHRHCLWNGLMAASPGHPFLSQTIQVVVNNIRNRYTSVDYDDMLCPDPVLSVAHTVDTLFTCGPCVLGASLNDVLHLHRQTGFGYGEIDLFQAERQKGEVIIGADDPRLLIPGRSLLLKQNKQDMGAHRFTWDDANIVVAATDMPEYDDRPKSLEHYSKTHEKFGIYGLHKLYTDSIRANEEVVITLNH